MAKSLEKEEGDRIPSLTLRNGSSAFTDTL